MAKAAMTTSIKSSEARQKFSGLINQVFRTKTRVIVERSGIPVAALVPAEDLERLQRFEAQRERDFSIIDEMREAFKDVPPEELEREVAKAIAEVRQERRSASRKT